MSTLLYNDDLAPITTNIGFIAAETARVIETYIDWSSKIGTKLRRQEIQPPLNVALTRLLPLTTREKRRFLFAPTASDWVAYFDNFIQGSDASPVMAHMAKLLRTRALRITAISDERERTRDNRKRDPAVILELFEPHPTEWLNLGRSLAVMNDGNGWTFEVKGTPQPFEEPENYRKPKIKDRFTIEMLDRYLRTLGISAFDGDFYLPRSRTAIFLEKENPPVPGIKSFDLNEAFLRHRSKS